MIVSLRIHRGFVTSLGIRYHVKENQGGLLMCFVLGPTKLDGRGSPYNGENGLPQENFSKPQ